jgi:dienelactone hydrolase
VPEAKWLEFSLGNALNTPRDPPGEKITFQSLTFGFENPAPVLPLSVAGRPTEVSGFLALPVADAPLPAMVVMHGCDGISASEIEWAKTLNKLGVATLVVDRYGPRNIAETCTYREFINSASALVDAFRALEVLSTNPRIDPARIGIMGMSLGGQLTLTTSQVRFQERYGKGAATFATYIALYPAGCVTRMIDEERVRGGMIRIFHGAADDWTLIGPCRQYIERLRRASVDAALHEYAGAHHAFDNPALTVTRLNAVRGTGNCTFEERDGKIVDTVTGLGPMSSKCWSQGATVGYNADAHRQVKADIERILSELFKLK